MTFKQAQKKRYALERLAQLKHNTDFDEPECKNSLLIIALIVALFGGLAMHFVYKTSAPAESSNNHPEDFKY